MVQSERITGILPALITPFTEELDLNLEAVPDIVKPLLDAGCAGLFVCGATGEPTTMTISERMSMAEATISEIGGSVPVIIHVGAAKIDDAIRLARHAQSAGASAIGSLPPLNRESFEQDIGYYTQIGGAADLPFYVYWRADMARGNVTPEQFLDSMRGVPNFRGIKFTDPNFYFLQRIIALSDGKLNCLTGPDEMFIAGLVMGSDGAIGTTYNFMANHFIGMYKNFLASQIQEAMTKQQQANELISLLIQYGIITGTKAIMEQRGIPAGPARPNNILTPYKPISQRQLEEMQTLVEEFNLK